MVEQHSSAAATAPPARECDVLIIGGGPAGATAGALLAQRGHQVTVLEKAHHPRFHIGESLLPANLPLLDKLGVADAVRAVSIEKWGAEFVSPWHAPSSQTFQFAEAWDKSMPHSYEVRRSEFDDILIRNAAARGATVVEGCRVTDVDIQGTEGTTVTARQEDGTVRTLRTRFLIDASGREVADLSESFAREGFTAADLDAGTLPSGSYYCRIEIGRWSRLLGAVMVAR